MYCPVCEVRDYDVVLNLKCGGFDNSPLYDTITVISCKNCGHIYNLLSEKDIKGLDEYYKEEYSKCNIDSPNKKGDIPGNNSEDSLNRYNELYQLIKEDIFLDTRILDVGCAMGGFLESLKPYCNIRFGIELSDRFIDVAKKKNNNIYKGSAENIPFIDDSFDIIVADQVVEHLVNPNIFFKEAKRTLKDNGILCISVPDANEYYKNSFFDFYFFLMREHIQHFGWVQLEAIANKNGFSLIEKKTTYPNLISNVGKLPNLTMKFKKDGGNDNWNSKVRIYKNDLINKNKQYINNSYRQLIKRREDIDKLENISLLGIYGMSREFHYLWNNTTLNKFNVILFDDTKHKQTMSVDGKEILDSNLINYCNINKILITSFAHINTLKDKLKELNFKGEIVS